MTPAQEALLHRLQITEETARKIAEDWNNWHGAPMGHEGTLKHFHAAPNLTPEDRKACSDLFSETMQELLARMRAA